MATTTFNTRISLKYDTYAQWVEKDPQLLVGEVAVVVVPAETGAVAKEPAVLFKVGDGAHKFSELQFTAGLAADVYERRNTSRDESPKLPFDILTRTPPEYPCVHGERCILPRFMCHELSRLDDALQDICTEGE